jgi:predicted cupin superfamily sugar epimerase
MNHTDAEAIVAKLGLRPLPVEGGLFVLTWRSDDSPTPAGTATYAAFTGHPDSFSAMHRLSVDEIWHFYLGDPVDLLLLHPDGTHSTPRLGSDVLAGQSPAHCAHQPLVRGVTGARRHVRALRDTRPRLPQRALRGRRQRRSDRGVAERRG